jgi:hypothetical protein
MGTVGQTANDGCKTRVRDDSIWNHTTDYQGEHMSANAGKRRGKWPAIVAVEHEMALPIKEYEKYGRYARPLAEVRAILERELGARTLTEELHAMREET